MKRPLSTIFIVFYFASAAFSQREDESWQQEVQDSDASFYEIREHYE